MNLLKTPATKFFAIGMIALSMIVMLYLLYRQSHSERQTVERIVNQSVQLTEKELSRFFLPIKHLIRATTDRQRRGMLSDIPQQGLYNYFIPLIRRYPQVSSIGLADTRGRELDILPGTEPQTWLGRHVRVDEWGGIQRWSKWQLKDSLKLLDKWEEALSHDPRTRVWFQGAMSTDSSQLFWSPPYIFNTNNEPGITVCTRWQASATDSVQYITAFDLTLLDISRFTSQLQLSDNLKVYVLTGDGSRIIGLPQGPDYKDENRLKANLLLRPQEYADEELNSILDEQTRDSLITFKSNGSNWWGIAKPFPLTENQQLLIAIALPESDILMNIKSLRKALVAGFLIILLLSVALFLLHNEQLRANQLLGEKNEVISQEKSRSDALLLNILPTPIAQELKKAGAVEAKSYEMVTVLFTDVKGFSLISKEFPPQELVAEIDHCFRAFDKIMEAHSIEKIKTIGDAYMAAAGVPHHNSTNAVDAVNAALDILNYMKTYKRQRVEEGKRYFEIRIGVHTGPVVAGIVGIKKFSYDIWGDTVNTASQIEGKGEVGKVNISAATYQFVKEHFRCVCRGKIAIKHKGAVEMYFVEGKK